MTRGKAGVISVLALCTVGLAAVPVEASSPGGPEDLAPYRTAQDARPVRGTAVSTEGPRLRPGTYTDTIFAGQKKYYRVELDARTNVYVSAVLAPPPESRVQPTDGIRVTLESTDGVECSVSNEVSFGSATPRPIADYATRRIGNGRECQGAGDYLYSVEWTGSGGGPGVGGWPVELKYMTEPGLKAGAVVPSAPSTWGAQAPEPATGTAKGVSGGTGFNDAPAVGQGVWKDELSPGESRFYKVPVDWGQQLFLDAEFANSTTEQAPVVVDGLRLSLFNTARGFVRSADTNYLGKPAAVGFGTAPAAFANRGSSQDDTGAMRFSGWYYVRVTLDRQIDSSLPMTLRVGIEGEPQQGPAYDGDATAAGFGITDADRAAAQEGRVEDGGAENAGLKALGIGAIGLGTVLLLGLGTWALVGRRGEVTEQVPLPWEP
ncbi:hypothetical protein ACQEVG_24870 [Streptomyces sp. CA-135486]|uniref:hypothetical protein n=1 Tax=Streptomyces sp. CA-135486 TaxID=3240049 RepID=UPI003D8B9C24